MKTKMFVILIVLIQTQFLFAVINSYQFEGYFNSAQGGTDAFKSINYFSGNFIYDSSSGWISGGNGTANFPNMISFSVILNSPNEDYYFYNSSFTRKQISIVNNNEEADSFIFFADNWQGGWPASIICRIFLDDYDKTVFPGNPEFPSLPTSLVLEDFESRKFVFTVYSLPTNSTAELQGIITELKLIPEPATLFLLAVGGLLLRLK